MKFEFFFSPDPWALARRYAVISLLRAIWLFLLEFDVSDLFLGMLPLQPTGIHTTIAWAVSSAMRFLQVGLLIAIGYRLWKRHVSPSTSPEAIIVDSTRLARPWWSTMLLLTAALIPTSYIIFGVVRQFMDTGPSLYRYRASGLEQYFPSLGLWPLYVALALGIFGIIVGYFFLKKVEHQSIENLGVKYLDEDYWLTKRVHHYAAQLNLPPPRVGVMNAVNAYAVGTTRENATVVIGVPLIKALNIEEVDAIIGHELGHIASGDMRRMMYAEGYQAMFGGLFSFIGIMVTSVFVASAKSDYDKQFAHSTGSNLTMSGRAAIFFVGELIVKGVSRSREFYADAIGASLTSPEAMQGALEKLSKIPANPTPAEQNYGYLMFRGSEFFLTPFSTHPAMSKRVEALKQRTHLDALPRRR